MRVQDFILMFVSLSFIYSLIPQIRLIAKNPDAVKSFSLQMLIISSLGCFAISCCYATLSLYFSASVNMITAIMWAYILGVKLKKRDSVIIYRRPTKTKEEINRVKQLHSN